MEISKLKIKKENYLWNSSIPNKIKKIPIGIVAYLIFLLFVFFQRKKRKREITDFSVKPLIFRQLCKTT